MKFGGALSRLLLAVVVISAAGVASASENEANWDALSGSISEEGSFQLASTEVWFEECAKPFEMSALSEASTIIGGVSNYKLLDQPSGMCSQAAACAFTNCAGIFNETYGDLAIATFWQATNVSGDTYPVLPEQDVLEAASGESSELPSAIVHPGHAGDVVSAVKFAIEEDLAVSVRTSGHAWTGSSNRKGSLLLNLSKLKKYALPESLDQSIYECADVPEDATVEISRSDTTSALMMSLSAACKLASARGKKAVLRSGGGQIVDEVLRTVEAWNNDDNNVQKYHPMIGSAGTVSSAGGWLASGGLGGSLGMRMYGIGVDQVLQIEMVLPSGQFVRFGPSSWDDQIFNRLYPQTMEVTGYCNEGVLEDESQWNWVECSSDDEPPFEDLWFAVRGGGGGSYGVVTSVYYQLHDKPGPMQQVGFVGPITRIYTDPILSIDEKEAISYSFFEFLFNFLYNPEKVDVSYEVSSFCSSPDSGTLVCYSGAGQELVDAWARIGNGTMPLEFWEWSSYAEQNLSEGANFGLPDDHPWNYRIHDLPPGQTLFLVPTNPIVFPVEIFQSKLDKFLDIYIPCVSASYDGKGEPCLLNFPYFYGANTQLSSDGMDAYPPHRRNGALHTYIFIPSVKEEFMKLIFDVPAITGTHFPGIYCHNHLFPVPGSPRKSNWIEDCNGMPGEGDCMSLQEAAFGTENLRRLEKIHAEVDPNRLFQTSDGPGYDDEDEEASSGGVGITGTNLPSFVVVLCIFFMVF